MIKRQRDTARIRKDAMQVAIKKARAGCLPCVQGYLELAKHHGATKDELLRAMETAAGGSTHGISRRNLLTLAIAAATGLAIGATGLLPARAEAAGSYWGTDTNTASCCGLPQQFYAGRLGYGTSQGDTQYFNVAAANAAGTASTYAYWDVEGPDGASTDPYSWGQQQGQTAAGQWSNNPNAGYVWETTIFGDIESQNPGWGNNQAANQAVLQGFLDGIQHFPGDTPLTPGVYTSPLQWQAFFGTGYQTSQNFALWISGCQTCVVSCRPCDSCSDTPAQVESVLPAISQIALGGSSVVLWQYWIGNCGCGDFDIAIQDPASGFTPLSGPVYQCTGCGVGGCS